MNNRTSALAFAVYVLACGLITSSAWADGNSDQPVAASAPTSTPALASSTITKPGKTVVLPKFEVNGLRERIDTRQATIEKNGYKDFMCLNNGSLIDNMVFLCKYRIAHPTEIIRFIIWQKNTWNPRMGILKQAAEAGGLGSPDLAQHEGLEDPTQDNAAHVGIGDIADSRMIDDLAVYTSGNELHAHGSRLGDQVYPDFKAAQIRKLTNEDLTVATNDMIVEPPQGSMAEGTVHASSMPIGVDGDDANLQVYYAQSKLKEISVPSIVVPATEKTGPNTDKMLIFAIGQNFYVWRPYYGAYRLKKESLAQFGIKQDQIADSVTHK
jgi:hypothetical protein